jgi:predicted pyridoxine 5'-phosphate oxidase superfamily flavin-nucleotide-binding protein
MVKIAEEMKGVINQAKVVALATATEAGEPNVVPVPTGAIIINVDSIYSISPGPDAGEQIG